MVQTRKVVTSLSSFPLIFYFFSIHTLPCCLCLTLSSSTLSLSLWCNPPDYCSIHPFQYANHPLANCLSAALIKLSDTYRKCVSKPFNPPPEECDVIDYHCNIKILLKLVPRMRTYEGICMKEYAELTVLSHSFSMTSHNPSLCLLTLCLPVSLQASHCPLILLLNVLSHSFFPSSHTPSPCLLIILLHVFSCSFFLSSHSSSSRLLNVLLRVLSHSCCCTLTLLDCPLTFPFYCSFRPLSVLLHFLTIFWHFLVWSSHIPFYLITLPSNHTLYNLCYMFLLLWPIATLLFCCPLSCLSWNTQPFFPVSWFLAVPSHTICIFKFLSISSSFCPLTPLLAVLSHSILLSSHGPFRCPLSLKTCDLHLEKCELAHLQSACWR